MMWIVARPEHASPALEAWRDGSLKGRRFPSAIKMRKGYEPMKPAICNGSRCRKSR